MSNKPRKKSPRAPSISLEEAISRAISIYEKEQRHAAPTDVIAQDLGYKSANNGAALATIAALKGFGLLDRPAAGKLAVSSDVQSYKYAPDEEVRQSLLLKWVKTPPIFSELLDSYKNALPSEKTIRYDLIERGFKPGTAENTLKVFVDSVNFANYYEDELANRESAAEYAKLNILNDSDDSEENQVSDKPKSISNTTQGNRIAVARDARPIDNAEMDNIPVRLDPERRAWLLIPTPFYEKDKDRLKAQIDLLITDE